jgi:methenyltetrahydromethanopterin cyclohydrolase
MSDAAAITDLNGRAQRVADAMSTRAAELRIASHTVAGARVIDCGVHAPGGLAAGLALARVCLADLADVSLVPSQLLGAVCPEVQVVTDHPVAACMASQYAGWQVAVGKYFAMGSGPMRAASGREPLFDAIGHRETPAVAVGVLEGRKLPDETVVEWIAERTGVPASGLTLLTAATASRAGSVQVVARSVETALHKLHELGFDIARVVSAFGTAPLPPVADSDLAAIGRTNDAILYGGRVMLWCRGDDASIGEIGPHVPSSASPDHGMPFAELFRRAGGDFYKIDPHLFSPAEVVFANPDTGRTVRFGRVEPEILRNSFGMPD